MTLKKGAKIKTMGFKVLANKGQSKTNLLAIHTSDTGCCPEGLSVCKYEVIADPFIDFQSITTLVDDEEVVIDFANVQTSNPDHVKGNTFDFEVPVITCKEAKKAIRAALRCEAAGGQSSDCKTKDFDTIEDGASKTICIYSEVEVVRLTGSDGTEYPATEKCDTKVICKFQSYVQELTSVTIKGVTTDIVPVLVYGVNDVSEFQAAIDPLLEDPNSAIVTDEGTHITITYSLENVDGKPYTNGKESVFCNCGTQYFEVAKSGKK